MVDRQSPPSRLLWSAACAHSLFQELDEQTLRAANASVGCIIKQGRQKYMAHEWMSDSWHLILWMKGLDHGTISKVQRLLRGPLFSGALEGVGYNFYQILKGS